MLTRPLLFLLLCSAAGYGQSQSPLQQVGVIPLLGVRGRIDHLSIDVKNGRLFVAALGNNTVEVVDLKSAKRVDSIAGLSEPQGVLYVPSVNRVYVANGGDGSLRIFDGSSFRLLKTIGYGDDADNIRYGADHNRVYVGYGGGALGAIDQDGAKTGDIRLDAHPESFEIETNGSRIFVNLPGSRKIAVIDRTKGSVETSWSIPGATGLRIPSRM